MPETALRMKERIVVCATELFMEKGYRATTLNDILQEAGIARGTLYHHFDSKEDLLCTVAERIKARYLDVIKEAAADRGKDVLQRMADIDEGMISLPETEWIRRELRSLDVDASLILNVLRSSLEEALPYYAQMVEEGVEQGVIVTPHPQTAAMLLPMINLMVLQMEEDAAGRMDYFRRLMLESVDTKSYHQLGK